MQMKGECIMKDNYDFCNAVVKNYSSEIPIAEKLRIILGAFMATENISKEELKKEVNEILA